MKFFGLVVRGAAMCGAATALGCATEPPPPSIPESAASVSAPAPEPAPAEPTPASAAPPLATAPPAAPLPPPEAKTPGAAGSATQSTQKPHKAGEMCGGIAGFRCADNLYCGFPLNSKCGSGDMAGACQSKPEICNDLFDPVCGCDGKTYPNACHAQRAGVSVATTKACKP